MLIRAPLEEADELLAGTLLAAALADDVLDAALVADALDATLLAEALVVALVADAPDAALVAEALDAADDDAPPPHPTSATAHKAAHNATTMTKAVDFFMLAPSLPPEKPSSCIIEARPLI